MGARKGQVRVRGTCKTGHVTETRSDPGRVTWEGTCSAEGCDLPVKARRVPRERDTPPPAAPPPDVPDDDPDDAKLKKVNYAASTPKPRGQARRADPAAGDKPADAAPAADLQAAQPSEDEQPAVDRRHAVSTGDGPIRPGLRARLRARRETRPAAAFRLPWED